MLDWLIYAGAALAAAIAVLLAIASRRPDTFRVQRSIAINAAPERVYPLIANLKSMNAWNPFVDPDPAIRITYSGPESGQGAAHAWKGNRHVGEGSLEITGAVASSRLDMRLQMFRPFKADNAVEFVLAPSRGATTVTWAMSGRQPLLPKLMSMFFDCDRMVGSQFEKGLARLKAIAER